MRICSPTAGSAPNSSRAVVAPRITTLAPARSSASREAAALGDRPVAHLEEILVHAVDRRGPVGVADHDRRRAADHAGRGGDARHFGADALRDRLPTAPSAVPSPARRPPEVNEPGDDHEHIGAERLDPLLDRLAGAGRHRHHDDHRGDADDHAEHGKEAPERIHFQRGDGDLARGERVHARVLDDLAVAEGEPPPRALGDVGLMGDDDHGDAGRVQLLEQGDDLLGGTAVERAGRLVGEEDVRVVDQRAGDRHPLLLAAGKLGGLMVLAMGEPDLGEAGLGLVARVAVAARRIEQGEGDIVERAGPRQQIEGLEHEADLLVAVERELIRAEAARARGPRLVSEPLVGVSSAPIRFMKVDLPEPEAPVTARYSPRSTSTLMPCSAPIDAAAELVGLDQIAGDDLRSAADAPRCGRFFRCSRRRLAHAHHHFGALGQAFDHLGDVAVGEAEPHLVRPERAVLIGPYRRPARPARASAAPSPRISCISPV